MATDKDLRTLDRDQHILDRLSNIQHRVDSIDQTSAFALRADAEKHVAVVMKIFGTSKRRAQIYLAADGEMSVQEIADHLEMKRQNVGADLQALGNEALLGVLDSRGGKDLWGKKPLDRTLRISKILMERFSLGPTGMEVASKKPKGRSGKR